ncbi:phosphatidylinositol 4-phosphate 5-kinase-like protein 1 isoform X1 [Alosa sapidissima]|uniref:phosphatidylinositol 4-phosphate 5-kinase-like protein 1 isoform X1 n=1 Tax=Alosa sapidissima TaxID=34773 RepID=UPI001C0A25A4|nr:phosphatidylinositol 4-phosphate 5-kinase-like protein 1 isoform X1 [Alosa sapidissima]
MTHTEMEMSGAGQPRRSRTVKRRRWGGLRQQWKLLGLFEIDQQHDFYGLTCMMKEGLSAAIQNSIDNPLPEELSDDDFRMEVTQIHKDFRMESFAGPVFASLRRSLGMTEKEYQHSLSSEGHYLQFISNSKSKADFFLTNDKRFFLKTQNKREVRFLLSNLKIYMEHLENYPHSLLVKFLGVHRIKIPQQRKKYFIVMQSVFYPDERIDARYDIKGCQVSRWTEPAPEGTQVIVVLKDLNFEGQFITLDQQRPWLLRQVEIDTAFLQTLNVLDYSLLLAHQPLHQDERHQSLSFATLIMRTKKSISALTAKGGTSRSMITSSSPTHTGTAPSVPGTVPEEESTILVSQTDCGMQQCRVVETHKGSCEVEEEVGSVHGEPCGRGARTGSAELRDFQTQNRRLLPNFKNPLHVIDGPEQRYFIGIIDIFTVYGFKKRLEHWWKRLRHPGQTFSTVSPPAYCTRLCQWVQDHTK